MRKTMKVLTVVVGLSIWSLLPLDGSLHAFTGSFTFNFQNNVIPSPKPGGPNSITVFAKGAVGTSETKYTGTFVFTQAGATEQQVRDMVAADMAAEGWVVTKPPTEPNVLVVAGRHTPQGFRPTRELGRGDNHEDIAVAYSANADIDEVTAFQPTWGIVIGGLSADAVHPGTIVVRFNDIQVAAPLAPFDAGEQVVMKLANAMTNAGFQVTPVVTRFGGHVLLNWSNPINFNLLGGTVEAVLELRNAAGGPNLLLTLPLASSSNPPPPPPGGGRP